MGAHEPAARRQRLPAAERRAELLAAAEQIFGERGYHGASIDIIARQAGISKALIYEHFDSKRALHAALLEEHVGRALRAAGRQRRDGATGESACAAASTRSSPTSRSTAARSGSCSRHRRPRGRRRRGAVQEQAAGLLVALMRADPDAPDRPGPRRGPDQRGRAIELLASSSRARCRPSRTGGATSPDVPRAELVDRAVDFTWTGLRALSR
jgi:AcrR family transcriptional regulator